METLKNNIGGITIENLITKKKVLKKKLLVPHDVIFAVLTTTTVSGIDSCEVYAPS